MQSFLLLMLKAQVGISLIRESIAFVSLNVRTVITLSALAGFKLSKYIRVMEK